MLHADQELCWRGSNQCEICLGAIYTVLIAGRLEWHVNFPPPLPSQFSLGGSFCRKFKKYVCECA